MSADNGVYILQSKDGFRVAHAQAIENLNWWDKKCCDHPIVDDFKSESDCWIRVCINCKTFVIGEERPEINPKVLKEYFGDSKILPTKEEALLEANRIYEEILSDPICPICEYGISFIKGWEDKDFPEIESTNDSKKEYTLTVDIAVFANNQEEAIKLVGQKLNDGNFKYWLGDVIEEKAKGE